MAGMQNAQKDKSLTYVFFFYSGALLIWSIYDFFVHDQIGIQMPILLIGLALYLWTKVFFHRRDLKNL